MFKTGYIDLTSWMGWAELGVIMLAIFVFIFIPYFIGDIKGWWGRN